MKYYEPTPATMPTTWEDAVPRQAIEFNPCPEEDDVERTDMHFDLYDIDQRYDELLNDYNNLEADMEAKYEAEIDELNTTILDLEDQVWEHTDQSDNIASLESTIEDLKADNEELEDHIRLLVDDLQEAENKIADLEYEAEQTNPHPRGGRSRR